MQMEIDPAAEGHEGELFFTVIGQFHAGFFFIIRENESAYSIGLLVPIRTFSKRTSADSVWGISAKAVCRKMATLLHFYRFHTGKSM